MTERVEYISSNLAARYAKILGIEGEQVQQMVGEILDHCSKAYAREDREKVRWADLINISAFVMKFTLLQHGLARPIIRVRDKQEKKAVEITAQGLNTGDPGMFAVGIYSAIRPWAKAEQKEELRDKIGEIVKNK